MALRVTLRVMIHLMARVVPWSRSDIAQAVAAVRHERPDTYIRAGLRAMPADVADVCRPVAADLQPSPVTIITAAVGYLSKHYDELPAGVATVIARREASDRIDAVDWSDEAKQLRVVAPGWWDELAEDPALYRELLEMADEGGDDDDQ